MKGTPQKTEHGQILVLIMLGLVGLIGITALTVDGGNAYWDRRHAQNAADTAAMAAGLAKIRQPEGTTPADAWKKAGYDRATANGYLESGPKSTVVVYACTEASANCTLPAGAKLEDYVQVQITSQVNTWFAPLVGIKQVTNRVEAIARAQPAEPTKWYDGNALVAVMPGCKPPGWPDDPFTVSGGSDTVVTGSGVFVNSNCADAYTQVGSGTLHSEEGICSVGSPSTYTPGLTVPPPTHDCGQKDPSTYLLPNPYCDRPGKITPLGDKTYFATPGTYNGDFPGIAQAGTLKLIKGLYCINGDIAVGSQWNITTDFNGDGQYQDYEGVMFFVPNGSVTFNGGSTLNLHAITCHDCGLDEALVGTLLYLPPTNTSTVKLNGNGESVFVGTILAPGSLITLAGGSSTSDMNLWSQIIGYSIKLTGGSHLSINYDETLNATTWTNPELQPFK